MIAYVAWVILELLCISHTSPERLRGSNPNVLALADELVAICPSLPLPLIRLVRLPALLHLVLPRVFVSAGPEDKPPPLHRYSDLHRRLPRVSLRIFCRRLCKYFLCDVVDLLNF